MATMGERLRQRKIRGGGHLAERDRGQTAIEFVGVTPLIILLLVALWQCALIGYTFSLASNSADVAARKGATSESINWREECRQAAKEDLPDAWAENATVTCEAPPNGLVTAEVHMPVPVLVPGVLDWQWSLPAEASAVRES